MLTLSSPNAARSKPGSLHDCARASCTAITSRVTAADAMHRVRNAIAPIVHRAEKSAECLIGCVHRDAGSRIAHDVGEPRYGEPLMLRSSIVVVSTRRRKLSFP